WAFVADALIAHHIPKSEMIIEDKAKINIFLQSWKTDKTKLPPDLKMLLVTAKNHNVRLDGLAFSRNIIRQMPIWFHIESPKIRRLNRSQESKCLLHKHNVRTVGDTENIARMTRTARHTRKQDCHCTSCVGIQTQTGCKNPYRCISKARELLNTLPQKWNPLRKLPEDSEPAELPPNISNDSQVFDWRITTQGTLTDAFRIFTSGAKNTSLPDRYWNPNDAEEWITIYTDGSCEKNGDSDAVAGAGVYCPEIPRSNQAIRLPRDLKQSNQTGEIIA
ncbi:hypothetical protein C8J55DRAFT_386713, partial [Lentinula edodes]